MSSNIASGNSLPFVTAAGSAALTWAIASVTHGGVAVMISHEQANNARPMAALSVGGVSFTRIAYHQHGTGSSYAYAEIWLCNAASAASIGTNPTITVTPAASGSGICAGTIVTVQDIDQDLSHYTFSAGDGQISTSAVTAALTGFEAGALILGSFCDQTGLVQINTGLGDAVTEFTGSDVTFNSNNSRGVQFYGLAADSTPSVSAQRATPSGTVYQAMVLVGIPSYAAASAVLTGATPSGTLATQQSATVGATTDQASGTAYAVLSTVSGDLTSITASQIMAGHIASDAAAPHSGSASVTGLTIGIPVTGLSPNTTYYYAIVQSNANGESNIVTGSFTTAVASRTVTFRLRSRSTGPLNNATLRFFTAYTIYGAVVDGGTSGLEFTANSSGYFTLTGLTINAGAGEVRTLDPSDPTRSIIIPVTFVAGA